MIDKNVTIFSEFFLLHKYDNSNFLLRAYLFFCEIFAESLSAFLQIVPLVCEANSMFFQSP